MGAALVIALLSGLIADFLHIPSAVPVIITGGSLLPIVLIPVVMGALQGLQRFGRFGWGQITAAFLRLGLGVGFILFGWGVSGALLGSLLAGLGAFLLGWWWLRDLRVRSESPGIQEEDYSGLGAGVSRFTLIVAFSLLAFMILTYIDTVAVKSRFLPLEAGLYSAVATIGRVVLYASTAVVTIMFPKVTGEHARGRPTARLACRALLLTTGLSAAGLLIFSMRPEFIMQLLFGPQFTAEAGLLVPYSIAMLLLAAVDVWMLYFLAVQEIRYTIFLLAGSFLLVAVLFAMPLSLTGVVWAMMFCNAALVLAGGLLLWRL
jgi:O-antigen/teichoic acid export membrane protein